MKRSHLWLAATMMATALTAHAGLIGSNVTLNYHFESSSSTDNIFVTAGTEVECTGGGTGNANICSILTGPNQSLNFGDDFITYTYTRTNGVEAHFLASDPNGFDFQNLNLGQPIANVILSSTIAGLDASRLTFTGNSIQLNMSDLPLDCNETFTVRMVTNPEPSAGLLGALGVLLLVAQQTVQKRQRR